MDAKLLIEVLQGAGYEPRSYSGRGMYGRQCVGVTLGRTASEFGLGVAVCREALDLLGSGETDSFLAALARLTVSTDSMGPGQILYFPGVQWPADVKSPDEDDDDYQK